MNDVCERCNEKVNGGCLYAFGYKFICNKCYDELEDLRDLKSADDILKDEVCHNLNPEQTVKNFVKYFVEYQKTKSKKLLDVLWRLFCWAGHADHTSYTAISEIMKWQKFKFYTEFEKFEGEK